MSRDVAAWLGTSQAQISNIESGKHGVSEERLRRLAEHYACDDGRLVDALAEMANSRDKGWWDEYRSVLAAKALDLAELEHHAAYVVLSGAQLPCVLRATAQTVYLRMHGPDHDQLYAGCYGDADLACWADRIREWRGGGHDVYVYFNNDGFGHAVRNAEALRRSLADR